MALPDKNTQTPSPHRFLHGQPRPPATPQQPPSRLRKTVNQDQERENTFVDAPGPSVRPNVRPAFTPARPPPTEATQQAQQFAPTPRFGYGRPASSAAAQTPSSDDRRDLRLLGLSRRPAEDVEDAASSDGDHAEDVGGDVMLLDDADVQEDVEVLRTTEVEDFVDELQRRREQRYRDLPFSPKRRRLLRPPGHEDEADEAEEEAMTGDPSKAPRHESAHDSTTGADPPAVPSTTEETPRRPVFLRPAPPRATTTSHDPPLPDAFSPHRRGTKFVPGGLAATVQQWIVQAGQDALASWPPRGPSRFVRAADDVLRVEVTEVRGRGPYMLRGVVPDDDGEQGGEVRMMLSAAARLAAPEQLSTGMVMAVRAPTWEIVLGDDDTWVVGVDWRVLSRA